MKITVDRQRCAGHALCAATAPDVYALDADGYCNIEPDTEVPEELEGAALAGARACPERAITVSTET